MSCSFQVIHAFKCQSCRFYNNTQGEEFWQGWCVNENTQPDDYVPSNAPGNFAQIETARELCNQEGDGNFVYFEPMENE